MSITATYTAYPQSTIDAIKNGDDISQEPLATLDLDKMWDALHYLLTGENLMTALAENGGEPLNDPLSQALTGQTTLYGDADEGIYANISDAAQVTRIAEALAQTDLAARLHACPLDTFTAAAIYPDIWDDPAEYPALEQELHDWYNALRDYYHHAAAAQCGVLVNIG
jgi:hypothetical protein